MRLELSLLHAAATRVEPPLGKGRRLMFVGTEAEIQEKSPFCSYF